MVKKISLLVATLFAVALMGCEQQHNQTESATKTQANEVQTNGSQMGNAEAGAMSPGDQSQAPAPAPAPAEDQSAQ